MASLYYYTARDLNGAFVRGSLEAGTPSAALADLRTRALYVTSLESAASTRGTIAAALQFGGVSQKSVVTFFRSFATLVRAGVPMRRSLDVMIQECGDSRLREALRAVACDIENGLALSDAMARYPKEFPRVYVAMIRGGELGGVLDDVLERVAGAVERDRAARNRIAAALTYPAIVACAAIGLILFLITTIVPMFRSMYEQMHVPLPPITAVLISAGTVLHSPVAWLVMGTAVLLLSLTVVRLRASERGGVMLESIMHSFPVAGVIAKKATTARLARMLGTLLRSGVGLVAALEVVTDVVTSARYRQSITGLRQALREGSTVCGPLAATGLYEPMFVQMLRVGEETGALDVMLLRIADYYDLDIETLLTALGSMLEPAMILLLGGAVGFIVAAIFIPLYTLIGNMK
ncbi:MAG TPA: type II secretion system F family protein [Candidatus Baltobacteraceae bacterium]|nr:type II secretion system F family protein [Candidatus Baltobacteraceae bacterium]